MKQTTNINDLAKALAAAQAEIKQPAKNSTNPHFKSRYADLTAVIDAALAVLPQHGLAVVQAVDYDPTNALVILETVLMHESGQAISSFYPVIPQQATPQGYGSALTYARRYALSALLLLAADDDDDGEQGSKSPGRQPEPKPEPKPRQAERPASDPGLLPYDLAAAVKSSDGTPYGDLEPERWAHMLRSVERSLGSSDLTPEMMGQLEHKRAALKTLIAGK